MKTIDEIALEVCQDMGLIANSVYEAFAHKFLAAYLEQQTPVDWVCWLDDDKTQEIGYAQLNKYELTDP